MPKSQTNKLILLNLSPWSYGGFASVTAHAYRCLIAEGWEVEILRPNNNRDERTTRLMSLGVPYRNVSVDTARRLCEGVPSLMTGVAREKDLKDPQTIYKLIDVGARVIVHGYTEHKQFQHLDYLGKSGQGVCVRESMCGVYTAIEQYLPHPYFPKYLSQWIDSPQSSLLTRRDRAASVAMVVKHKHPEIILEANRQITKLLGTDEFHIKFLGGEDRMFAKFTLSKRYPEYEFTQRFSSKVHPASVCSKHQIMVDLTVFGAGNGGTQYTFMEAMDAGSVLVVHKDWLQDVGDMQEGVNCLAVATSTELAELVCTLRYKQQLTSLREGYRVLLDQHGPKSFSNSIRRLFNC